MMLLPHAFPFPFAFPQIKISSPIPKRTLTTRDCLKGNNSLSPRLYSQEQVKETQTEEQKRCLRCGTVYQDKNNSPTSCSFHGHINGERGLFALAPPHQGIDGEWSDKSGVTVYRWNDKGSRPNTGSSNWKSRWSCCSEYDEDAPPCRCGWHVSYDDGHTLY